MNLHPALTAYMKQKDITLRPLQKEALEKTLVSKQGQVFMPTGTGKTIVEVLTTLDILLRKQDDGGKGVAVFASHRLLLCEQLLGQLIKYAHDLGMNFDVLTVASDGIHEDDVVNLREGLGDLLRFCKVQMTTTMDEVATFIAESTTQRHRHVLVVATYQSFDRLKKTSQIDIACMDEAHTIVEQEKFDNVQEVLNTGIISRIFYFTATPVIGYNGRGMDNSKVFGPVLNGNGKGVAPRTAIDYGDILPPVIHNVTVEGKGILAAIIKQCYEKHRQKIQQISGLERVAQLLVSVEAIDEMVRLVKAQSTPKQESFQDWARNHGIQVVAFSSAKGYFINGHEETRRKAIEHLRELSKGNKPFILFHYDILTEGIDIPNLTGVLPLRELNRVKFLQTCGRAARITKSDRELLKQGIKSTIGADRVVQLNQNMEKPCYWVIDPQTNKATSAELVKMIREEYELEPFSKDIEDLRPPTDDIKEVSPPFSEKGLNIAENEARTTLTHEYEVYRLMVLAETEKGKKQIIAALGTVLDSQPEEAHVEEVKPGSDPVETPLPEADWVGTPESGAEHPVDGGGSLTKLLGY